MRTLVFFAVLACACEPKVQPTVVAPPPDTQARADACQDDIPDCAAACALRETHRDEWIDFYNRRCAAVILGRNPDKIEPLQPTPYASVAPAASSAPASTEFPPTNRGSFSLQPPPAFDPTAVTRTGGSEPPECKAARMLRAQNRGHEADMLSALCAAKGGDAGI